MANKQSGKVAFITGAGRQRLLRNVAGDKKGVRRFEDVTAQAGMDKITDVCLAAAFVAGEVRTAALRARTAARLLVLPQAGLTALRRDHTSVYDVLLGRALAVLAERIEATLGRISEDAAAGHARMPIFFSWAPKLNPSMPRSTTRHSLIRKAASP